MIDGLKIQMAAAELAARLTERADWNDAEGVEYEQQLRLPPNARDDPRTPDHILAHESKEHRARAMTLRLLRDHLVPDETYLLDERDLQFADLVPEFSMDMCMIPPFPHDEDEVDAQ
jgi:hypothetical protein